MTQSHAPEGSDGRRTVVHLLRQHAGDLRVSGDAATDFTQAGARLGVERVERHQARERFERALVVVQSLVT